AHRSGVIAPKKFELFLSAHRIRWQPRYVKWSMITMTCYCDSFENINRSIPKVSPIATLLPPLRFLALCDQIGLSSSKARPLGENIRLFNRFNIASASAHEMERHRLSACYNGRPVRHGCRDTRRVRANS